MAVGGGGAGAGAAPGPHMVQMAQALQALVGHGANAEALHKIQYYASGIRKCDGTVASEVREWLQAIDTVDQQAPNGLVLEVASNTAVGTLNRELEHFVTATVNAMPPGPPAPVRGAVGWAALRTHLQASFLSINEEENLKLELERVQRATYQTVPQYNVDFRAKAVRAYAPPWNAATNRILVRAYVRSLNDRRLSGKVLDAQPANLNAAMTRADQVSAVDEQRTQLLGPEPMDVSALGYGDVTPRTPARSAPLSTTDAKLDKLIELLTLQATQSQRGNRRQGPQRRKFEFTPDGKPICNGCKKPGHVWRDCRQRQGSNPPKPVSNTKN